MRVKFEANLTYDADLMHGDKADARQWFFENILVGDGNLSLFCDTIGDVIGTAKITKYLEVEK